MNNSIPLLKEKPEGHEYLYSNPPTIFSNSKEYYYCKVCEGWIEGHPNTSKVNTLGPLCGRKGTESHCIRCGRKIAFFGVIS